MDELLEAARAVRTNAYAPYSVYQVGAAIRGADGVIYTGCNVENVSFGLSLCAERSAVAAMVAAGCRSVQAVAVVTKDGGTPCGMCRQVLAEFAESGETPVRCADEAGRTASYTVGELLPSQFRTDLSAN